MLSALLLAPLLTLGGRTWMGLLMWWRPFQAAQDDAATLEAMTASGEIRPAIDRGYPLGRIVEALGWVDDGHARGKVLVTMEEVVAARPS
jgi:NADPH:quinone reductase-like Zn-dependent oxidoreductase